MVGANRREHRGDRPLVLDVDQVMDILRMVDGRRPASAADDHVSASQVVLGEVLAQSRTRAGD